MTRGAGFCDRCFAVGQDDADVGVKVGVGGMEVLGVYKAAADGCCS
jgi:hypothetical protein